LPQETVAAGRCNAWLCRCEAGSALAQPGGEENQQVMLKPLGPLKVRRIVMNLNAYLKPAQPAPRFEAQVPAQVELGNVIRTERPRWKRIPAVRSVREAIRTQRRSCDHLERDRAPPDRQRGIERDGAELCLRVVLR
jgi:hypothetical protein